jgi:hypothetical protein
MIVTKEEYQQLLTSEGFKLYRSFLEKLLSDLKEEWALGNLTSELADGTLQMNAAAVGRALLLKDLLSEDMTYETIMETINEK